MLMKPESMPAIQYLQGFGLFLSSAVYASKGGGNVICNQKVVGSIPIAGTSKIKGLQRCSPFCFQAG